MWTETLKYLLMTIVGLTLVVSLLMLLVAAFILKGKHDLGVGFEEQCSDYYYERERGDFLAAEEYEKIVKKLFYITIVLLSSCYLLVTFVAILLVSVFTYLNWRDIGFGGAVEYTFFNKITQNPGIFIFTMLIIILIVGIFGTGIGLWIYSIVHYKTYANSKIKFSISPFANGTTPSVFIRNQLIIILATLLCTIFLQATMFYSNETTKGMNQVIIITLCILTVLIPFISYYIHKFNNSIQSYLTTLKDTSSFKTLRENPSLLRTRYSELEPYLPSSGIVESSKVADPYMYIMHTRNNYNVKDIVIPDSFKEYLLYVYTTDRYANLIKERLLGFYIARHQVMRGTPADLEYKNYNELIASNNFIQIKDFLNMRKVTDKKQAFVNTINNDILKNASVFNIPRQINPMTLEDQAKLDALRNNTILKDTIGSYYNRSKIIVYTISFIALYIVYHGLYGVLQEKHLQTWAMVLVILIIAVLIYGFVAMKSQWL